MESRKRKEEPIVQRMINGVWVDISKFRSAVFGYDGKMMVCENYEQYEKALASNQWFDKKPEPKPEVSPVKGKKHGSDS